ncbi:probable vacuolar amino acid transporter YPQ3 [Carica papaya]|uniref:probable vacuolar amino acid transporter YPQ3 n=1 Tax=Carica papaya TaxID=3649 RepID=UPI000B8D0BDB|nr:probable vacuolar amino acid transporter YPQ3 [Carica papaya]
MAVLTSLTLECPRNGHCSDWAREYMQYCLCSVRDKVSLTLGLVSVISWCVAEIPQIVTNYKDKSADGLSIAFLTTWTLGDLFNLFGCLLEPATLPTQYYTAVLYTVTTLILVMQSVYYGQIYPQLKYRKNQKINSEAEVAEMRKQVSNTDTRRFRADTGHLLSTPIPLPVAQPNNSPGRELYYRSARSLSSSYNPTAGSLSAQRMTPPHSSSIEEPFLVRGLSTPSVPALTTKSIVTSVSAIMLLALRSLTLNRSPVLLPAFNSFPYLFCKRELEFKPGVLEIWFQFQVIGGNMVHSFEDSGFGSFLGWVMAAVYMGGRLPQICLNIRRGNVEGLNPLMFFFALVGNATYVASILVSSLEWSRIRPNLPWLVDAGGCVLLDTLILSQFIYFRYCFRPQDADDKQENLDVA